MPADCAASAGSGSWLCWLQCSLYEHHAAGFETTAITMTSSVYNLSQDPVSEGKMAAEAAAQPGKPFSCRCSRTDMLSK